MSIALSPEELAYRKTNRRWSIGMGTSVLVIFALFNFVLPSASPEVRTFFNNWLSLNSLGEAAVFVLMALGLNIVVGYAGLLDLGYVAFWALGGYVAGWLMSGFWFNLNINIFGTPSPGLPEGIHLNFLLVLVAAGAFTALWGLIIGAPTLRLKSDYIALVTLGFGEIIPQVFLNGENIAGINFTNGTKGITPIDNIRFGAWELGPFDLAPKFLIYSTLAAGMIFLSLRLRDGRLGRAWLAIREDELAASMMGVPLMRTKLASYFVGAIAGGVGGAAFTTLINGVFAERFNFAVSIIILAMVVLGGMGNVWGVTMGAIILSWINSTGLVQFGEVFNAAAGTSINFPSYNFLVFGLLLVLMMLFRREGFFPEARTRMIMHEEELEDAEFVAHDAAAKGGKH